MGQIPHLPIRMRTRTSAAHSARTGTGGPKHFFGNTLTTTTQVANKQHKIINIQHKNNTKNASSAVTLPQRAALVPTAHAAGAMALQATPGSGKADSARRQVEKGLAGTMAEPCSSNSNMSDASSAATLDSGHVEYLSAMPACDLACSMKRRHELRRGLKRFFKHVDLCSTAGPVQALPPVLLHQLVQMHDESLDANIAGNRLSEGAHAFVALLRSLLYEALRVEPKQRVAARHAVLLQVAAHSRHAVAYVAYSYPDEGGASPGQPGNVRGRTDSWDALQPNTNVTGGSGNTNGRGDEPSGVSTSPTDSDEATGGAAASASGSNGSHGGVFSTSDDGTSAMQSAVQAPALRDSDSAQSNRTQDGGSDAQQGRVGGSSGDGASGASADAGGVANMPEGTTRGQALAKPTPHCRATLAASRSLGAMFGVRLHGSNPRALRHFMSHRNVRFSHSGASETSTSSDSSVEETPVVQHHVALQHMSGLMVMPRMKAVRQSVQKTCSSYVFRGTYMRQVAGSATRTENAYSSEGSGSGSDSMRRSGTGNPWSDPAGGTDPSAGSVQSSVTTAFQPFTGTEAVALQWAEWRGPQSLDGMCMHFLSACSGSGSASKTASPVQRSNSTEANVAAPVLTQVPVPSEHGAAAALNTSYVPAAPLSTSTRSSGKTSTVL